LIFKEKKPNLNLWYVKVQQMVNEERKVLLKETNKKTIKYEG
jgi:hypothetical protein